MYNDLEISFTQILTYRGLYTNQK